MDSENVFEAPEVVEYYRYRPDYPRTLLQRLSDIAPSHDALLDLGCGPGKISRQLAPEFSHVDAIDPSANMLHLGKTLPGGDAPNITWIRSAAEESPLPHAPYDLIVAAASIHWMDQERLFRRLRTVTNDSVIAVVDGDAPHEPPWRMPWSAFMERWIPELTGQRFGAKAFVQRMRRYADHIDVLGEETFESQPIRQSVSDFIACQHSRKTFCYPKLGSLAERFDAELFELLSPYAVDGHLTFTVSTSLTWGRMN